MTVTLLLDTIRHGDGRESRDVPMAMATRRSDQPEPTASGEVAADERALIARIQSGDTDAFDAMVEAWWTPLKHFARTQVESDAAAEDLVQNVFAWIWVWHETWAPTHSVRAYLYRMVRNRLIGERRHARVVRAHVAYEEGIAGRNVDPDRDAAAILEQKELLARLEAALARLPASRREVVLLRYVHGLTYAEVAAVTGASRAAVEKQITRALEHLRVWLSD